MSISTHAYNSGVLGSNANQTVTLPAVSDGDCVIVVFAWGSPSVTVTPPSGYTAVPSTLVNGSSCSAQSFYNIWHTGDTTTPVFVLSLAQVACYSVATYTSSFGTFPSNPIDVSAVDFNSSGSTTETSPSVTPTRSADELIQTYATLSTSPVTVSAPSLGVLETQSGTGSGPTTAIVDSLRSDTSATGAQHVTISTSHTSAGAQIAIYDVAPSVGVGPLPSRRIRAHRILGTRAKRPTRRNPKLFTPPTPPHANFPEQIRRKGQNRRIPTTKAKKPLRGNLTVQRIPQAPHANLPLAVRHPRGQAKRIARVKAKRAVRDNLQLRIPQAPAATLPLSLRRPRGQKKGITQTRTKKPLRSNLTIQRIAGITVPANITNVNEWTAAGSPGNVLSIATNTGAQIQVGDVLVASIADNTSEGTPPAGWSTAVPWWGISSSAGQTVYYKVAAAGDIGASFAFNTTNVYAAGGIKAFRGVDNANPIDAAGTGSSGTGTTITAASITPVYSGDALLWLESNDGTPIITIPVGENSAWNIAGIGGANYGSVTAYQLGLSSGPTGAISGSSSGSTDWTAVLVALKPAAILPIVSLLPLPVRRPQVQRRRLPRTTAKRVTRSNIELRIPQAPTATLAVSVRDRKAQAKRLSRVKAKRAVRNNLQLRISQAPAATLPLSVRRPQAQKKRIAQVKAKRPARSSIELRIPPAPAPPGLPLPARRPQGQRKRLALTKPKRRGRSNIQLRIPPAPIAVRAPLTGVRKPQAKRIPGIHPKKITRSSIQLRIPHAPSLATPTLPLSVRRPGQKRRLPQVKPKRNTRSSIQLRIARATTSPLSVRHPQGQRKRIIRVKAKRPIRSSIELRIPQAPSPTMPLSVRRRGQKKRLTRVKAKPSVRDNIQLRIPAAPAPRLPITVRRAQEQPKRLPRTRPKRAVRSSTQLRIPPQALTVKTVLIVPGTLTGAYIVPAGLTALRVVPANLTGLDIVPAYLAGTRIVLDYILLQPTFLTRERDLNIGVR